jgi:uncharacterized integral membrane protein
MMPEKGKTNKMKLVAVLVPVIIIIVIILENLQPVPVQALSLTGEVSLALIVALATGIGFVAGLLVATFRKQKDSTP